MKQVWTTDELGECRTLNHDELAFLDRLIKSAQKLETLSPVPPSTANAAKCANVIGKARKIN